MGLPERITNSPQPGTAANLTTLSGNLGSITAGATTFNVAAAAPANLQGQGQTHVLIDAEIIIVDTSTTNGTAWTVIQRGAEGSIAAAHNDGQPIYQILTEEAMANLLAGGIDAKSASFTALANMTHVCTGAIPATLPSAPRAGTRVTIVSLTGLVTVARGGTDTITERQVTAKTSIGVPAGTTVTLKYNGTIWYPSADSRPIGWDTWARAYYSAGADPGFAAGTSKLNLNNITFDVYNHFDVVTNHRYNCPYTGLYAFDMGIDMYGASGGSQLARNGVISTAVTDGQAVGSGPTGLAVPSTASDKIKCNAGDYLELWFYMPTAGTIYATDANPARHNYLTVGMIA